MSTRPMAALAVACTFAIALAASCSGTPAAMPPREPGALPGGSAEPVPPALTDAEKERMDLEAVYKAIETGDFAFAESRLSGLAASRPDNRSYPVLRASVLLSMGRLVDARKLLEAELSAWPGNLDALYALAELERFAGDAKAHRAAIEALLLKEPANADARVSMGDILYDGKNYAKAEENYSAALSAAPGNADAMLGLARVKYRREDYKGALALLDRAVAATPGDPIAYLDRSRALYQLGRYAECEADMDSAVRLAPDSAWNYVERGRLYLDTNRLDAAMADFSRSIELKADYFLPYVYRASIFENAGKDVDAMADYSKATELYPEYWYSFESIAVLAWRLGDWKKSFEAFDKAATYTKSHPEYYVAAGLALMRAGEPKAAKDYAARTLARIDREKFPAMWLAQRLVFDQGDMTAELELRAGAEKSLDARAGILFYLGSYWVARGRPELGSKYLRMSYDAERIGTIERRMAEADLARLATAK